MFTLTNSGELRREEGCATADFDTESIEMSKCVNLEQIMNRKKRNVRNEKRKQLWKHTKGGQIINDMTGQCLTTAGADSGADVKITDCNEDDVHQLWWFQTYSDISVD